MASVALTLLVGAVGWIVARRLGLSAPAMLGSMLAVGICNALFGFANMPQEVKILAQSVSGAFIAMSIRRKDIANMKKLLIPAAILFSLLTVNTLAIGYVLHHVCGIEVYTALFSSVAGGIADISMIAMDFSQCDPSEVAFLQTSRLVAVLLMFPAWIKFLCNRMGEQEAPEVSCDEDEPTRMPKWLSHILCTSKRQTIATFIMCVALGVAGKVSGIPAGIMIFAMMGTAAVNLAFGCCHMPPITKKGAQLLAGSLVGSSISAATFSNLQTAVIPVIVLLISYWFINFLYSIICYRFHLLDLKSALFASAPGGASDMVLIAADLDADLAKIAALQLLRSIYAVTLMPTVVVLVAPILG